MAGEGQPAQKLLTAAQILAMLLTVDGAGSGLDADTLDGIDSAGFVQIAGTQTITGAKTFSAAAAFSAGLSAAGQITSTVATGTAPLVVDSTTVVANLNASLLLGGTWAIPGSIGATTPNAGAFTTLSASGTLAVTGTTTTAAINASGAVTITAIGSAINTDASAELLTLHRTSAHGCYLHIKNSTKDYILAADINNNGGSDFTIFDNTSGATRLQISGTGDTSITGALKLGNAYVATPPTCTGYVTLKDSTGTTYKVLVST